MSDVIISVSNLGKKYRIKHQAEGRRYTALRDVIAEKAKGFFKKLKSGNAENLKSEAAGPISAFQDVSVSAFKGGVSGTEDFWALRDVSFEVKRGEVVGIIGRNGAGKSTLLKILSRITEPTTGRVHLRGRVASLLEVGTGFHPELTGRENVFLNGAILGMSRAEIRKKFDEIVAFAEVEKFLDTPVKRYSSGMYVRLAFAVAAHLEPEILIVDEVLAVGDAEFQKKCLGKMGEVAKKEGRTVLFVSHNKAAIQRLCGRCILLRNGKVVCIGATSTVIEDYANESISNTKTPLDTLTNRSGTGAIRLIGFHLEDMDGNKLERVMSGSDFDIVLQYRCAGPAAIRWVDIGISLHQMDETVLSVLYSSYTGRIFDSIPFCGEFRCRIKHFPFQHGIYLVGARVLSGNEEADWPRQMIGRVEVLESDFYGSGKIGFEGVAPLLLSGNWTVR